MMQKYEVRRPDGRLVGVMSVDVPPNGALSMAVMPSIRPTDPKAFAMSIQTLTFLKPPAPVVVLGSIVPTLVYDGKMKHLKNVRGFWRV